jgi:hypothetical protein
MHYGRKILQFSNKIHYSEFRDSKEFYKQVRGDDKSFAAKQGIDAIILMDPDEELADSATRPLEDWHSDFFLNNNSLSNDILINSYLSVVNLGRKKDINDLTDEDNLLSFNNGVYMNEDLNDPIDVRSSYY